MEPFGGGGSVLLRKPRSYSEVYNDLDGDVVNLFRVTRDHGEELRRRVDLTPFARVEFIQAYETSEDPIERARQTLIRSFMGHGSSAATWGLSRGGKPATGFRNNVRRSATIPAHDWAGFPEAMAAVIERLRGVVIEQMDAFALIEKLDGPGTLFYVDPPYLPETRDDSRPDYRHELTKEDHERLAQVLTAAQGKILLSGYASDFYESLYAGWHRVERAAMADGAKPRIEVLWMNYEPGQTALAL